MTFEDRNRPRTLSDLVFHDAQTEQSISPLFSPQTTRNLLLYGEGGSGKSATCRVLAETLVGPRFHTDITTINVSRITSKAALCDLIVDTNSFAQFNGLGRNIMVLEELDGADRSAQMALKGVLDERARFTLFLATTNNVTGIIQPLRDRFLEMWFAHPDAQQWAARAVQIMGNEGVQVTPAIAVNLLRLKAPSGSMRDVMRELDAFAQTVRQANSSIPPSSVPIASVSPILPAVISATAPLPASSMSPGDDDNA